MTSNPSSAVLDNTPLVESPEGYGGDDWTFRKELEAEFLSLRFKSRKFSHEKEPETRLTDSLWLTWHRDSPKQTIETVYNIVDSIEVRVTFASQETSDCETTVSINAYGKIRKSRSPYRMGKMNLVLKTHDTTELFHHIHHFMTKPL